MSSRIPWLRPRGLTSDQVEERFRTLLVNAGVRLEAPASADVDRAWAVMREFAKEPVIDAAPAVRNGDLLRARFGTHDRGEGEWFSLDLVRQLIFNDARGDFSHVGQLHCEFVFEATDELKALGVADAWSSAGGVDEFFEQARALPAFVAVQERELRPRSLQISYSRRL